MKIAVQKRVSTWPPSLVSELTEVNESFIPLILDYFNIRNTPKISLMTALLIYHNGYIKSQPLPCKNHEWSDPYRRKFIWFTTASINSSNITVQKAARRSPRIQITYKHFYYNFHHIKQYKSLWFPRYDPKKTGLRKQMTSQPRYRFHFLVYNS